MALLEQQLEQASDENIQRMRQTQIAAAEAGYKRCTQEVDSAMERADVVAGPVAFGLIYVDGEVSYAK